MFNRIHQKLGTAGFIISIVALVAALGGGAYAASGGLNGKQKKEVEKIAKKVSGGASTSTSKPGPAGATGPAGAAGGKGDTGAPGAPGKEGTAGTNGSAGSPGTPGTNGKSVVTGSFTGEEGGCTAGGATVQVEGSPTSKKFVCNGTSGGGGTGGEYPNFLPTGKTEVGTWSFQNGEVAAGEEFERGFTPISFNLPLEVAPANIVVTPTETPTEKAAKGCAGSAALPTAAPGTLCIYTSLVFGPGEGEFFTGGGGSFQFAPFQGNGSGAVLSAFVKPHTFALGSWAVTAP
jgi:hypothetical protein